VHVDIPGTERGCYLETNKAGADHHHVPCYQSLGGKSATVRKSAQIAHVREVIARNIEPNRVGACGEKECVIGVSVTIRQFHMSAPDVDRGHMRTRAVQRS
jgi:hypothetical protein